MKVVEFFFPRWTNTLLFEAKGKTKKDCKYILYLKILIFSPYRFENLKNFQVRSNSFSFIQGSYIHMCIHVNLLLYFACFYHLMFKNWLLKLHIINFMIAELDLFLFSTFFFHTLTFIIHLYISSKSNYSFDFYSFTIHIFLIFIIWK